MSYNLKLFTLIFLLFNSLFVVSQTIINTENMISDLDDNFSFNMNFEGDLNFGNIDLIQFSTAQQLSKSVNKHLFLGYKKINLVLNCILLEVFSGIMMYYFDFPFLSQPLHLVIASILFGIQMYILLEILHQKRMINKTIA